MRRDGAKRGGRTAPRYAHLAGALCLLLALGAAGIFAADTLSLHRAGDADQAVIAEGVAALEADAQRELPDLRAMREANAETPGGQEQPTDTETPDNSDTPAETEQPAETPEVPAGDDEPTETEAPAEEPDAPAEEDDPAEEPDAPAETEPLELTAEQERILALDLSTVTKAQIAERFGNAAVVGDSIAYAAWEYSFLDAAHVFAKIGVSLSKADEQFDACIRAYPEMVVLIFGENDLELYGSRVERFAEAYRERLEQLGSELPYAEVYALAILPIQEGVAVENENYQYISDYNAALESLCAELGAHYVDAGFLLRAMPELYDADGIHPKANFYTYLFTYLGDMAGL